MIRIFMVTSEGSSMDNAFKVAKNQARVAHGNSGYTGTIAEKTSCVEIELPKGADARAFANELIDKDDERIEDKWGPAGAIRLSNLSWLFFGWANY